MLENVDKMGFSQFFAVTDFGFLAPPPPPSSLSTPPPPSSAYAIDLRIELRHDETISLTANLSHSHTNT